MTRAVYIGGFGNGRACAERVSDALGQHYEDVYPFTFREAMNDTERVRCAVKNVDVLTHSAGMLAVRDTQPRLVAAFNAPVGGFTTQTALVARSVIKTTRMHLPGVGIRSMEDAKAVAAYDLSAGIELALHAKENLRHLGAIASFDSIQTAYAAQRSGVPVHLMHTTGDEYFPWSHQDMAYAENSGVTVVGLGSGIHDELIIRPESTLATYYQELAQ